MTNQDMYTEKISLWLDDELNTAEIAELHAHLATCMHCQNAYQGMRHVDQLLVNAAKVMMAPLPGFAHRVETRLAHHRPTKAWQIWLALGALVVGALIFLSFWAVMGGITLYSLGQSMLDTGLVVHGMVIVIDTADSFRFLLNLGTLALKTSILTMKQPLFWGCVITAALLAGLWVRIIQTLFKRGAAVVEMML